MKKTALALTIMLLLFVSLMVGVQSVKVARANPYEGSFNTVWKIQSPKNLTTYDTDSLNFSFECVTNDLWDEYYDHINLEYIIDGPDYYEGSTYIMPYSDKRVAIEATLTSQAPPDRFNVSRKTFQYSTQLPSLSNGQHTLTIYKEFKSWGPDKPFVSTQHETIIFYIETIAPKITNLSISSTDTADRLLNFTVDEETSWIDYSLDNQANITINGNTTLAGLSQGSHTLIVYANDTSGNMGFSQIAYFTVTQLQPEPFPTTSVIASIGSVAVVGLGLLVYLKKRQKGSVDKGVKLES